MGRDSLGRHVLVEFFGCDPDLLNDVTHIEQVMLRAAQEAGATIINSTFHHFSPFGVSGVVVVQESHLAIHTWPEFGYAAVDIFTCGEPVNPWKAYHLLKAELRAESGAALEMHRGQLDILKRNSRWQVTDVGGYPVLKPEIARHVWFTERHKYLAQSFRHRGDVLFRKKSAYQRVEVYETYAYGKMLVLDGLVQLTEKDEFIYHEMIAHVPLHVLPPEGLRVLIVGGGDGGTAREVARHPYVRHIDLVEIDRVVVEASEKFFPEVASGLHRERVHLHIEDGLRFVSQAASASYDVVLCDVSDPIGPSRGVFTQEFHRNLYRVLKPRGVMVIQSEGPFFDQEKFVQIFDMLQQIYGERVYPYWAGIPSYPTGVWFFMMGCKGDVHPLRTFDWSRAQRFAREHRLRYYTPGVHWSAFQLPPYVCQILDLDEDYLAEMAEWGWMSLDGSELSGVASSSSPANHR